MKNLKKVLALVLAFACAFTMFAGAAFTDSADINADNADAVELLTALNIIEGNPDGSFAPEKTVTRAQMAKMIYVIRNGGNDDASAYETVSTSFTDISGHWAEGYIKYLQNTGIVAGKSATKFDPNSTVTTGEAMKMALVLGGYRADKAGLTGSKWLNNTVSYATTYGLTKDVHSAVAGGCTRQDAAQILANALDMTAVQWSEFVNGFVNDSDSGLAISGDAITVGEKWMDLRTETGFLTKVPSAQTNPKGIKFQYTDADNKLHTVTFKNAAQDVSDLMGYEVKVVWNGANTDAADAIYGIYATSNNTSYEAAWKDIEKDNAKVKFDGKSYDLGSTSLDMNSDGTADKTGFLVFADKNWNNPDNTWTSSNFNKDNLSDTVTFIDNDGDGDLDAAQVHTQAVTKVGYIGSKNITTEALVGSQNFYGFAYDNSPDLDEITVDENIAADDYAVVTYDVYTDKVVYTKADVVEGKIEATRTESNTVQVRIDGDWYKCTDGYNYPTTMVAGDSVEYVAIGNLLYYIKKTDGTWGSKSLAAIYAASAYGVGVDAGKIEARLILRDGSKVKGIIAEIDGDDTLAATDVRDYIGQPMTYRINSDGEYELKSITNTNLAGYDSAVTWDTTATALNRTTGAVNTALSTNAAVSGDNLAGVELADDAVVFVVERSTINDSTDATDAKVFTGKQIKNLSASMQAGLKPTKESAILRSTDNGYTYTMVAGLHVASMPASLTGSSYGYLLSDAAETYVDADGYRLYDLWTSEGQVQAREKNGANYTYKAGTVLNFNIKSVDENGVWTIEDVNYPVAAAGMVTSSGNGKTAGSTIGINNSKYDITSDTVVLFVDTTDHKGVSFDEGVIMKADVTNGVDNIRYLALNSSNDLELLLVDVNNEMQTAPAIALGAAATQADIAAALTAGDVAIDKELDAGVTGLVVPAGRMLTITADQDQVSTITVAEDAALVVNASVADNSAVTVKNGGSYTYKGRELVGGTGLVSAGDITVKAVSSGKAEYTLNADAVLNGGLLEVAGADDLKGAFNVTGAAGAVIKVYAGASLTTNAWKLNIDGTANQSVAAGFSYTWNTSTNTWVKASLS